MSPGTDTGHDVVIVGARVAGAATALLLARQGIRVLVVDRARYGSDTLSTHALMRAGVLQLHRWGVLDRVVEGGTPPIRETTFDYGDARITVPIKPHGGIDALYAPRRTLLDRLLVDAATEAGATFRFGVSVTGVERDSRGRVAGVVCRDRAGRAVHAPARLVVGADGVRSMIARQVGAPVEQRGTAASQFVYGYWSDLDATGFEWYFPPGASAGLIPTGGDQVCVFAGSPASGFTGGVAGREAWYRRTLELAAPAAAERLATARPPEALRAYVGVPGFLRTPSGPGWALVGDAGAYRDPISAHGITDALRDAELLAREVPAALAAELADPLAGYRRDRDSIARPMLEVTDAMATYRWDTEAIGALHLRLSELLGDEIDLLEADADAPAA